MVFHKISTKIEHEAKQMLAQINKDPAYAFIRDDVARVQEFYTNPETGKLRFEKMQAVLCLLLSKDVETAAREISQSRLIPVHSSRPYVLTSMRETSEYWTSHAEFLYKKGLIFARGKLFSATKNTGFEPEGSFSKSRKHIDKQFEPILTILIDSTFYPKEPDSVPMDKQMRGYVVAQLMSPGKEKTVRLNALSHGLRKGLHEELLRKSAQITMTLAERANIVLPNGLVQGAVQSKPDGKSDSALKQPPSRGRNGILLPFLDGMTPMLTELENESLQFKRNLKLLAAKSMDMAKAVARYEYLYGNELAVDRTTEQAAKKFGCTKREIEASCRIVGMALERLEADNGLKAKP